MILHFRMFVMPSYPRGAKPLKAGSGSCISQVHALPSRHAACTKSCAVRMGYTPCSRSRRRSRTYDIETHFRRSV